MSDDKDSKTEEPTDKKLGEARDKGEFAKAEEIGVVFTLIATFCVLIFKAKEKASDVALFTVELFKHLPKINLNQEQAIELIHRIIYFCGDLLATLMISCVLGAILAGGLQSRFRIAKKALEPKFNKLNPAEGIKKIFSARQMISFALDLPKFIVVSVVLYIAIEKIRKHPFFFMPVSINYLPGFFLDIFLEVFINLIVALGAVGIIHYLYECYKNKKNLMMTKQEVRDELKQSTGNPEIKSAQRRAAMRIFRTQMLKDVPLADVVVTNPTHFAIALKYERGEDLAPVIIAKGENLFAERIKTIAKQFDVPIVENKLVARLLFKIGKIGSPIPVELYEMIANILSYVYRSNKYYFQQLKIRRQSVKKSKKLYKT